MTSWHKRFRNTGPLCGESGRRGFPSQRTSDVVLWCFLCCLLENCLQSRVSRYLRHFMHCCYVLLLNIDQFHPCIVKQSWRICANIKYQSTKCCNTTKRKQSITQTCTYFITCSAMCILYHLSRKIRKLHSIRPISGLSQLRPSDAYICAIHYDDVIISAMASQITSLTIVYSIVYSGADQRKHQSSASLAFVRVMHRWPVNSPHKGPVTRKMFPFDDVIMMSPDICAANRVNNYCMHTTGTPFTNMD